GEIVPEIDLEGRRAVVDPPPGLLDERIEDAHRTGRADQPGDAGSRTGGGGGDARQGNGA
ncbi:MAG TPA: ribosome maturation factor RimM, partial [Streptomyces sp.]|nr:ribosome maturation factor RimM [Streptomyces sp.]